MSDLSIDYQQVADTLAALKRATSLSEDSTDKTDWIHGDQTGTKWSRDESSTSFSSTYREFLTKLGTKVDQWSNDLSNAQTRTQQAQEALKNTSEEEAAAIHALLVEEWNQQSAPSPSSESEDGGPGLGFGVVSVGPADSGPGLGFEVTPVGPADSGAGAGSTSSGPGLGFGVVPVPGR